MKSLTSLKQQLKNLLFSQPLAVLATQDKGKPYGSLVAFAVTDDLKHLLFATTRSTRKYTNLSKNLKVAMVIDNRSNRVDDFYKAIAATATGTIEELKGKGKERYLKLYLSKHPYLKEFVSSPTCAFLRVKVDTYYIVSRFQNVMELHIRS